MGHFSINRLLSCGTICLQLVLLTTESESQPIIDQPRAQNVESQIFVAEDENSIEAALSSDERMMIQEALIFVGGYNTWVDGDFGPITRRSIRNFQSDFGFPPTGYLDDTQVLTLFSLRENHYSDYGLMLQNDPASYTSFELPSNLINSSIQNEFGGTDFISDDYPILIQTLKLYATNRSDLQSWYDEMILHPQTLVTYSVLHDLWFVVSGIQGDIIFYQRFHLHQGYIRGIKILWHANVHEEMMPIAMAITNSYQPFERRNLRPSRNYPTVERLLLQTTTNPERSYLPERFGDQEASGSVPRSDSHLSLVGTGSGVYVNEDGIILTALHVVESCYFVTKLSIDPLTNSLVDQFDRIPESDYAFIRHFDESNDLAAVWSPSENEHYVRFRSGSAIRLGEEIVAAGYPLTGILAPELNITNGLISSLSGIGSDRQYMQITAPIQSGNSGGPVLDRFGNLVGVVVARLDRESVASSSGSVPENVNFAVKSQFAEAMLVQAGIDYHENSDSNQHSFADIADMADDYTVILGCWD